MSGAPATTAARGSADVRPAAAIGLIGLAFDAHDREDQDGGRAFARGTIHR
jgi:hypothetical protein